MLHISKLQQSWNTEPIQTTEKRKINVVYRWKLRSSSVTHNGSSPNNPKGRTFPGTPCSTLLAGLIAYLEDQSPET